MKTAHYNLDGPIEKGDITSMAQDILNLNQDQLDENPVEHVVIHINSPGGDLRETLAGINLLQASNIPITTLVNVTAYSGAFLLLTIGDRRIAMHNAEAMSHSMSAGLEGTIHDLRATMRSMDSSDASMVSLLKETTGMNETFIKRSFVSNSDLYMNAEDMLRYGVVDIIVEPKDLMDTLNDYEKIEKKNGLKVPKLTRGPSRKRPTRKKS